MTSIEAINAAVIAAVKKVFPAIPFTAQEKLETIERPSFKLILDEIKTARVASGLAERVYPVELIYFAEDKARPKSECLAVYDKLWAVLLNYTDSFDSEINSDSALMAIDFELAETAEIPETESVGKDEDMETLFIQEDLHNGGYTSEH